MCTKQLRTIHQDCLDLSKCDNAFRIGDLQKNRFYSLLNEKASIEKLPLCRQSILPEPEVRSLPTSHHMENLRWAVQKCRVSKILSKREEQLLCFAAAALKDRHAELLQSLKIYSIKSILENPKDLVLPSKKSACKFLQNWNHSGESQVWFKIFICNKCVLANCKLLAFFKVCHEIVGLEFNGLNIQKESLNFRLRKLFDIAWERSRKQSVIMNRFWWQEDVQNWSWTFLQI